jgi:hypothetical protein
MRPSGVGLGHRLHRWAQMDCTRCNEAESLIARAELFASSWFRGGRFDKRKAASKAEGHYAAIRISPRMARMTEDGEKAGRTRRKSPRAEVALPGAESYPCFGSPSAKRQRQSEIHSECLYNARHDDYEEAVQSAGWCSWCRFVCVWRSVDYHRPMARVDQPRNLQQGLGFHDHRLPHGVFA